MGNSVALAALDRNVATAWCAALKARAAVGRELQAQQKARLLERDRCGTDPACLQDQLSQRLDDPSAR